MWRTPGGGRVLRGAEWAVFRRGLAAAWRAVERVRPAGWSAVLGVRLFDELPPDAQLTLLAAAGSALRERAAVPPPGAVGAAAAAAVYAVIGRRVRREAAREQAGEPPRRGWRRAVLRAAGAAAAPEVAWPDPSCTDGWEWAWVAEALADRVLWDRDFELAGGFLDADPAAAGPARAALGIPDGYFAAAAPDPGPLGVAAARAALARLTARPRR